MQSLRILAIDWSGAVDPRTQRKTIWIADWQDGQISLAGGRTREQLCQWLMEQARCSPQMTVGFDFAFSFPAWFLQEHGYANVFELWRVVGEGKGEEWLRECRAPFWGRPGRTCPTDHRHPGWRGFRETDRGQQTAGIRPKSPFQIGGAGAVGTGSLRGMAVLNQLRNAGWHIWPFDPPGFPVALEIYPRLFTGPVKKSSATARKAYLDAARFLGLPDDIRAGAVASEDGFDALVSALGMAEHAHQFAALEQASNATTLLEGAIWTP